MTITIELPWPDKRLSPNARVHHMELHRVKKRARYDAWALALQAIPKGYEPLCEPIPLAVTFYPPDKQSRDRDNTQAMLKAAFDGIADALKVDDALFRPEYQWGEPEKPGRVCVVIG